MASKIKWALEKAAVHNEPGLTTAQLMLTNDDLRPGETASEVNLGFASPMPLSFRVRERMVVVLR